MSIKHLGNTTGRKDWLDIHVDAIKSTDILVEQAGDIEVEGVIKADTIVEKTVALGTKVEDVTHKDGRAYSLTDSAPLINTELSNKKYIDDQIAIVAGIWDRTPGAPSYIEPDNVGDQLRVDLLRGQGATTIDVSGVTVDAGGITLSAGATCDNIDNDGTFTADSSTRLVTQSASKTYTDNHSSNAMWTKSGTNIYPTTLNDVIVGGTGAGNDLLIESTSNVSKGSIYLGQFEIDGINISTNSDMYIVCNATDGVEIRDSANNPLLTVSDPTSDVSIISGFRTEYLSDDTLVYIDNTKKMQDTTLSSNLTLTAGTLDTIQDIQTTSSPEFNGLSIGTSLLGNQKMRIITGATTASAVQIGEALDEGGWFTSLEDWQLAVSAGSEFGIAWVARATSASIINQNAGDITWYTDSGLTDGNPYTPTQRMKLDTSGILSIDTIQPNTANGDITIDALDTVATSTVYILNSDGGQLANLNVENDVTVSGVINVQNGILTDTVWNYTINGPLELDCVNTIQDSIVNIINSNVTYDAQLQINASTLVNAILDEDNMVSDSDKALATQQSIKAYIDNGGGVNWGDTRTSGSGAGLTHTVSASAPAGTKGFVTSLNATQTNPIVLYEANIGTSSASHTGFSCTGKLASNTNAFKFENTTQSGDTGTTFYSNVALNANTRHRSFYANCTTSSGSVNRTVNQFELIGSRTMASGLVRTDDYDLMNLSRYGVGSGAGTLTSLGAVLKLENGAGGVATNDSVKILEMIQDADSTGVCISITQNSLTSTNFRKLITEENTSISNWISDGATPNGSLNATAGDICLNGPSNKPYYCVGTTNWMELNSGSSNLFRATALLQSNITGDSTNYTCLWGTENYDTGGNFASPNYTAVSDGKYSFGFKLLVSGVLAANISIDAKFVINAVIFDGGYSPGGTWYVGTHHLDGHIEIDMLDGQTCYVTLRSTGGTKVLDILNSSYFYGHRMAD